MLRRYKTVLVLLLLVLPFGVGAQVKDDFTDGDFTSSPSWLGNETSFIINTSLQLQLNATAGNSAYLTLAANTTKLQHTEWNFWIKLAFAPSSLNNARVYLSADQQMLTKPVKGYYLQFGEASAADKVELFRQDSLTPISVCRGKTAISKSVEMRVKVVRDSAANWVIWVDSTGGTDFLPEAKGKDSTYNTAAYTGIVCNYTTSNAAKFYFDDFYMGGQLIDKQAPLIDSVAIRLPDKLIVYFNEAIDKVSALNAANYNVDHSLGEPTHVMVSTTSVTLTFPDKLQSGISYQLAAQQLKDVAGNTITPVSIPFYYYTTKPFDVVINEVMADPVIGCVDFVEIYNRSTSPVELNKLYLCSMDTFKNVLIQQKQICKKKLTLLPGNYLALSTDENVVKQHYFTPHGAAFLTMPSIPAMNNDGDVVVLADSSRQVIDKLIYFKSMHFPLLPTTKGVSLERIDFNRPATDKTNWHSAAEPAGFGTPGYKNSQYLSNELTNAVTINPEIFSPDNDGYNDVVTIGYNFNTVGNSATITIYDSAGRLVKTLVRNQLLAATGTFSWDGIKDNSEIAPSGIYIFSISLFDQKGNVKQVKKTAVLAIK
jgi:gliding motility-associated-like protein